jgi:FkbM family methyltransferase
MLPKFLRKAIWDVSSATPVFKGKWRIVSLLTQPSADDAIKISRHGVNWLLRGHDINEFMIAMFKEHSTVITRSLTKEIADNRHEVLWDIGANIGGISLPLLAENNDLVAIMFEPSAEVAGRLIRNTLSNPSLLGRATVMNVALSDSMGLVKFFVSSEPDNSGLAGLGHSHNRSSFPIMVQSYTGDSLIASGACPPPDVVKIDVEGFEIGVLKGLESTLAKTHPTVIFEHALYRLKELGRPHDEVTNFLRGIGYEVYRIETGKPVTLDDLNGDADFIAKKR